MRLANRENLSTEVARLELPLLSDTRIESVAQLPTACSEAVAIFAFSAALAIFWAEIEVFFPMAGSSPPFSFLTPV